jgi:hypothetical protein
MDAKIYCFYTALLNIVLFFFSFFDNKTTTKKKFNKLPADKKFKQRPATSNQKKSFEMKSSCKMLSLFIQATW